MELNPSAQGRIEPRTETPGSIAAAAAPPLIGATPPLITPEPHGQTATKPGTGSGSLRKPIAILLSACLGLFLADAAVSLLDDSLMLFSGLHLFGGLPGLIFLFSMLVSVVRYFLTGLTPMIPKRIFLPVTLFTPLAGLATIPFLIYFYTHIQDRKSTRLNSSH